MRTNPREIKDDPFKDLDIIQRNARKVAIALIIGASYFWFIKIVLL